MLTFPMDKLDTLGHGDFLPPIHLIEIPQYFRISFSHLLKGFKVNGKMNIHNNSLSIQF